MVAAVQLYEKSPAFHGTRKLYCNHKRPPMNIVLGLMNPVHTPTSYFFLRSILNVFPLPTLNAELSTSLSTDSLNLLNPTGHVMHQQFNIQQLYVLPTLYLCFVFIWEQTATCTTYSINWLVSITEMKSVYCAVRTGSLNKAVCASCLKG